ncbi:SAM-dependent DNA methyltransferase [Campylobacter upsaliensis]|nr:SAM-dependent DNA methyltransferase [Campylobacter upsaliensis]EAK6494113.1 SAM-dependent DNA methyltransferase [Campylobacter upsaliensis]
MQWNKEVQVDEWVREKLKSMGLKLGKDFLEKDASAYLKDALKGASKTKKQSGTGIPDFVCECYDLPVVIECKLGLLMLENKENHKISLSQTSIQNYAINGALHYAKHLIKSKKYKEVIAIGVAGDSEQKVAVKILYIYDENTYIQAKKGDFLFLENKDSFAEFYEDIILNDEQKHKFLLEKRTLITKHAKNLNKLMNDNSISTHERALYVAACLLSQQDIKNKAGNVLKKGLIPDDLTSQDDENYRDSVKIKNHIDEFLRQRDLDQEKVKLMINAFTRISINALRDKKKQKHKLVEKLLKEESSVNKQIFTYIYENIYKEINILNKNSKFYDVMGELYNEFLKYAMTDGKMGIVLTPSYVTKMMVQILEINADSKVMDLATGSAGFLIAAMDLMIDFARNAPNQNAKSKNEKIATIKQSQLLGVEENTDMFALATTNMILRGDGSSKIIQNDSFQVALELKEFKADRILLNPPFSYKENGMPFIKQGLDNMPRHALGAIIIQDSAGSGKAKDTNQDILKHHTLKASIKMPMDLFVPMAGVQTSIYIFEAKVPHDFEKPVKFIDFRNDGYKRTEKALQEVDNPIQRYIDILKIYKQGLNAKIDNSVYEKPINLSEVYVEDFISESGADWNFDQHKKIDTTPTLADFKKCVSEYLAWEVSNVLKNSCHTERSEVSKNTQADSINGGMEGNALSPRLAKLEKDFKQNGGEWKSFKIGELFDHLKPIKHTYNKGNLPTEPTAECDLPAITCTSANQGIACYMPRNGAEILKNVISVAANGDAPAFYQPHDFAILQDAYALRFKSELIQESVELSPLCYLYLTALLQKVLQKYNWNDKSGWAKVSQEIISLPILLIPSLRGSETSEAIHKTQQESKMDCHEVANATSRNDERDYEIAFNYMESYIKALEAERLQELEAYLKVTGLNDYTLSQKEKEALKAFENLSALNERERERERVSGTPNEVPLKWESFKIGELFEVMELKKLNPLDSREFRVKEPDSLHTIPAVVAKVGNNGVMYYVKENDYETSKNKIVIIADGAVASGLVYYHEKDFTILHNAYAVKLKNFQYEKRDICLFFVSAIQKAIFEIFNYENKPTWNKVKECFISLPVLPTACHTEPLGEVSQVESKRDFSLATQTQNDKNVESSATQDYQIAFDFIESFIKAIQKECIKSVVLWQKREAEAYRACVKED